MIIWIASYPKSGNTWLRSLLSAYLYTKDGEFEFNLLKNIDQFPSKEYFKEYSKELKHPVDTTKFWISAQKKINLSKKTVLLKTHNALCAIDGNNFTNKQNTLGCIYVVRDPRNIITSIKNHYEFDINEAFNFITNKRNFIFQTSEKNFGDTQFVGSWSEHYKSWNIENYLPVKLIRYEDLFRNTFAILKDLLKFLNSLEPNNFAFNKEKLMKCIETTQFHVLQKQEIEKGFYESVKSKKNNKMIKFFNLGEKNQWNKLLDQKTEKKIREIFSDEMKKLGYIV